MSSDTYSWLQRNKHDPWKIIRMPSVVHDEFLGVMTLWPWCRTHLRACLADIVVASDATLKHGGVAAAAVTPEQAVSLWSRQRWRKGALSYLGDEIPGEELFVSHAPMGADAALENAVQSLKFVRVVDYQYRERSHVNIQELLAWRTGVRWLANDPSRHSTRVLQVLDSQGRSSSKRLNNIMQSTLGHLMLSRQYPQPLWISSWAN
eukprot:415534-Amphidinium_carterae.2